MSDDLKNYLATQLKEFVSNLPRNKELESLKDGEWKWVDKAEYVKESERNLSCVLKVYCQPDGFPRYFRFNVSEIL